MNEDRLFRIFLRALLTWSLVGLGAVLLLFVLWQTRALLPPVVTGLLIGYLLFPLVRGAALHGVPRVLSVTLIITIVLFGIFQLVYQIVPRIQQEVTLLSASRLAPTVATKPIVTDVPPDQFGSDLTDPELDISDPAAPPVVLRQPERVDEAERAASTSLFIQSIQKLYSDLKKMEIVQGEAELEESEILQTIGGWISDSRAFLIASGGSLAVRSGQFLMVFIFVLVFTLLDGDRLYKFIIGMVPNSYLETSIFVLNKTEKILGDYLRGIAFETFLLFLVAWALLSVAAFGLQMRPDPASGEELQGLTFALALVIAVIIALTNIVRIIGPIIGGFIGILIVALAEPDVQSMFAVLIIVGLVQIIDNVLVLPLVMQDQVDVHPLLTMIGVLAGGLLAGVLGMVLAIPVIAGFKVLYRVIVVEIKRFDSDSSEDLADLWGDGRVMQVRLYEDL